MDTYPTFMGYPVADIYYSSKFMPYQPKPKAPVDMMSPPPQPKRQISVEEYRQTHRSNLKRPNQGE